MSTLFEPIAKANLIWRQNLPYSLDFEDIYFSSDGGFEEARHVFIEGNNLIQRWQALPQDKPCQFVIGETGFGSGLNFLLTWALWEQYAPKTASLYYLSCEKHPFSHTDLKRCIALWPYLEEFGAALLSKYPVLTPGFHGLTFNHGRINLTLMLGDGLQSYRQLIHCGVPELEEKLRSWKVDAWFLDGFAPAKNETLWSNPLFHTISLLSGLGTTAATFTAAGIVKEGLQSVGYQVKKVPGFGRKREMIVAEYRQVPSMPKRGDTPWHVSSLKKINQKKAIILGAGLAGCYTAYALARRGWKVDLIDNKANIAMGASGNQHAVLYPKLSPYQSPLTEFLLSSFLYAKNKYPYFLSQGVEGQLAGILQLAFNDRHLATNSLDRQMVSLFKLTCLIAISNDHRLCRKTWDVPMASIRLNFRDLMV